MNRLILPPDYRNEISNINAVFSYFQNQIKYIVIPPDYSNEIIVLQEEITRNNDRINSIVISDLQDGMTILE
jgi:hypothetical protein